MDSLLSSSRSSAAEAEAVIKTTKAELSKALPSGALQPITEANVLQNKESLSLQKHRLMDLQTKKSLSTSLATDNPFEDADARRATVGESCESLERRWCVLMLCLE
jgi:hypothetical protein